MRPWSVGQVGGGCVECSTIVYMSSGMFRGKESSNRIELSQLVKDLLNFGVFSFLQLLGVGGWVDGSGGWVDGSGGGWMGVGGGWGLGGWGWGVVGGAPHTVHMHMHICMCMHAHACMVNMVISCKWPPPLDFGKSWGFPMMSSLHVCVCTCICMHACAYVCMHVHVGRVHPLTTPDPHPPTPTRGDPWIIQNSIALELIEIFQFCLKIWNLWRLPHPWVGV